jgi:predicted Zn-dependent peptidase
MSDLQEITRPDAEAFFQKYYQPSNLVSVIAGDVDPKAIREFAETYFARIPSGPKPEPLRTVEPSQEAEHRVTLRLEAEPLVLMGYHRPDVNHPDNAAYKALSSLLSDGRSSRLYRSLVRDQKIAVQAFGFTGFPGQKYPELFLFGAFPAPGHKNDEIEKAIGHEIERLKNEPVTAEELAGVKRRTRANLINELRDNTQLANDLADAQVLTGDWHNLFRDIDKIDAVTPADIQRIAKSTFSDTNKTVAVIEKVAQ